MRLGFKEDKMRDIDKEPYSKDEERVAKFLYERGSGGGDDPIGFILSSYAYLVEERNKYREQRDKFRALYYGEKESNN
jgi:hypothetical protein